MIFEEKFGTRMACRLLGASRATLHRSRRTRRGPRSFIRRSHRRIPDAEYSMIVDVLHEERFTDISVREIYATLLDEGTYVCSTSTMYRIYRKLGESLERRRLAQHSPRVKPELIAIAPNCVWSWDITKLARPVKWTWYQAYVILDIHSRYLVGWRIESNEDGALAEELFAETIADRGIDPSKLTVHGDNGAAMTAKTLSRLFTDLSITRVTRARTFRTTIRFLNHNLKP